MARMLHHVDIRVSDVDASRAFYETVLRPLGFGVEFDGAGADGSREVRFGDREGTEFAIHEPSSNPGQDTITRGAHLAFRAAAPEAVDAFHVAAVGHGAQSIGDPGRRPEYSEGYYGAFVLDPDGNNVEAVCHIRRSNQS
jgi:catechol 2,3-dioxygenase-like lactoylglutathione lyase family enzyme